MIRRFAFVQLGDADGKSNVGDLCLTPFYPSPPNAGSCIGQHDGGIKEVAIRNRVQRESTGIRNFFAPASAWPNHFQPNSVRILDLNRVKLYDTAGQVGIVGLIVIVGAQAILLFIGNANRYNVQGEQHKDQITVHIL